MDCTKCGKELIGPGRKTCNDCLAQRRALRASRKTLMASQPPAPLVDDIIITESMLAAISAIPGEVCACGCGEVD